MGSVCIGYVLIRILDTIHSIQYTTTFIHMHLQYYRVPSLVKTPTEQCGRVSGVTLEEQTSGGYHPNKASLGTPSEQLTPHRRKLKALALLQFLEGHGHLVGMDVMHVLESFGSKE